MLTSSLNARRFVNDRVLSGYFRGMVPRGLIRNKFFQLLFSLFLSRDKCRSLLHIPQSFGGGNFRSPTSNNFPSRQFINRSAGSCCTFNVVEKFDPVSTTASTMAGYQCRQFSRRRHFQLQVTRFPQVAKRTISLGLRFFESSRGKWNV